MERLESNQSVDLRCPCGNNWKYKGKMRYATCPNCLRKVYNKDKNEDKQDD